MRPADVDMTGLGHGRCPSGHEGGGVREGGGTGGTGGRGRGGGDRGEGGDGGDNSARRLLRAAPSTSLSPRAVDPDELAIGNPYGKKARSCECQHVKRGWESAKWWVVLLVSHSGNQEKHPARAHLHVRNSQLRQTCCRLTKPAGRW